MVTKDTPVYVAGHTGLIGSAIVRRLCSENFSHIITRPRSQLDLIHQDSVERFFGETRPEVVFLCAGRVGGIIENRDHPAEFITQNLQIQTNVIQAAHKIGVKRFFYFGSSCMYPRECPQPMAEAALLTGVLELTSLPYAIAKLAGVYMCLAFNEQYGEKRFLPVIPNNAYGPGDNFDPTSSHVLAALLRRFHEAKVKGSPRVILWGTGTPRREVVYVDDIADACHFLLGQEIREIQLPLNIGVGIDYSVRELASTVAEVVGYTGSVECDTSKPDGAPRKMLDSSHLSSLGWRPRVGLEEGLRRTYDWFLTQKEHSR